MSFKRQVLVVANVTATSGELVDVLKERGMGGSAAFTLVMPATQRHANRADAIARVGEVVTRLREFGLEVDGSIGDGDPFVAVAEAWDPGRYDEIILSTLPVDVSKWLHADLPHRIERHTGALVTHVVSHAPKRETKTVQARKREKHGVITPLTVLTWGGPHKGR